MLIKKVEKLLGDENKLEEYRNNLKKMAVLNASEKIYDIIKSKIKNEI